MIHFLESGHYLNKITDKLMGWYEGIILRLAILTFVLFYFIARGVATLLSKLLRKHMDNISVRQIIKNLVFLIVLLIGFFISLNVLGLDKA